MPSSHGALPIWADFVSEVAGSQIRGAFPRPTGLDVVEIEPTTGARALRGCPSRESELFLQGTAPLATCPAGAARSDDAERPGVLRRTLRRLFGP
jgi:membrane carboxypeptidase/penicillin-binding protein